MQFTADKDLGLDFSPHVTWFHARKRERPIADFVLHVGVLARDAKIGGLGLAASKRL
jgi:hypothetical protein